MTIKDAPDGTLWVQTVNVVVETPTPSEPAHETPIVDLHRLSTSSTSYGTVASWTISTGKVGILGFVEMESDAYAKTMFKLTIGGTAMFTDLQIAASLSLEFPDLRLAAASQVLLEAKSTDGTSINVDGDIIGKEIG